MAVLHRKEEKIQAVLGRLPKKYSPDDFVAMFIKLYSKDWGKVKSAYIKASQDKEPGTVIHMPKPDLYLKQVLEIFLTQKPSTPIEVVKKESVIDKPVSVKEVEVKVPNKKVKASEKVSTVKKTKVDVAEKPVTKTTKAKVTVKKTKVIDAEPVVKKARVVKKKVD